MQTSTVGPAKYSIGEIRSMWLYGNIKSTVIFSILPKHTTEYHSSSSRRLYNPKYMIINDPDVVSGCIHCKNLSDWRNNNEDAQIHLSDIDEFLNTVCSSSVNPNIQNIIPEFGDSVEGKLYKIAGFEYTYVSRYDVDNGAQHIVLEILLRDAD